MIYAIFRHPKSGLGDDIKLAKDAGLILEKRYVVFNVEVDSWITHIRLNEVSGKFNSVQFDFEDESGNEIDIVDYMLGRN